MLILTRVPVKAARIIWRHSRPRLLHLEQGSGLTCPTPATVGTFV